MFNKRTVTEALRERAWKWFAAYLPIFSQDVKKWTHTVWEQEDQLEILGKQQNEKFSSAKHIYKTTQYKAYVGLSR